MKPLLLILVLAAASQLAPRSAHADPAIGWGDALGGGMVLDSPCQPPNQINELVCSFDIPSNLSKVTRLVAIVDFCVGLNPLPPWWGGTGVGSCTAPALSASAELVSGPTAMQDYWGTLADASLDYEVFALGQPNMARATITVTIDPEDAPAAVPDTQYQAFRFIIDATGATCSGCELSACFALNEVELTAPEGVFKYYGNYLGRYASWGSQIPGCPFIVPVTESSFGTLKAKYD